MGKIKVGDIVARKSYGFDILFKVSEIKHNGKENVYTLKGICYRIEADAPESDLHIEPDQRIREYNMRLNRVVDKKFRDLKEFRRFGGSKKIFYRDTPKDSAQKFSVPGKVLHIDGDNDYLETCLNQYIKFGINAVGKYIPEKNQPSEVYNALEEVRPDILVLTGHDGVIKGGNNYSSIHNYRNSRFFVDAVREARRYEMNMDSLVIFAGACQSLYNDIINAGANYASSPNRVLIHALDPVFICQKIAFTGIKKVLEPLEVINNTITGIDGIGGVQTRGKYRDGFPLELFTE